MGCGAYNSMMYDRFAFSADWSAALEFVRTGDSAITQAAHVLAAAGTVAGTSAVVADSAITQAAHVLDAAGTNAVASTSAVIQAAHVLASVGVNAVMADSAVIQAAHVLAATGTVAGTNAVVADSAITQAAHVLDAAGTVSAVPTCGRINIGYGAYNSVMYNLSAFNSDWPEVLGLARIGDSAVIQAAHVLAAAGTNAVASTSVVAQPANVLDAAGANAVVSTSAVIQAAHVLDAAGTVSAVPTCGRINIGYGAYNSVMYNLSAFNSDWPEVLGLARIGDSAVIQAAQTFTVAGTNAVASTSAVTQAAHVLDAAGANAVVSASAVTQPAHVLDAAGTVSAVLTCGRINIGYGAYNSVVYDRAAFNSDWSEVLGFARTSDSAVSSDDHVLSSASTWLFRVRQHPRGGKVTVH